jgi:hypothetical protein
MRNIITTFLFILFGCSFAWANPFMNKIDKSNTLIRYNDGDGNEYLLDLNSPKPIIETNNYGTLLSDFMRGNQSGTMIRYTNLDGEIYETNDGTNYLPTTSSNHKLGSNQGFRINEDKSISDRIIISPNPANQMTKLSMQASEANIRIKLNTVDGSFISELYNGFHPGGQFDLQIDTSKFTSGVYYLTVQYGADIRVVQLRVD